MAQAFRQAVSPAARRNFHQIGFAVGPFAALDIVKRRPQAKKRQQALQFVFQFFLMDEGQLKPAGAYGFSQSGSKRWLLKETKRSSPFTEKQSVSEEKPFCVMKSSTMNSPQWE